MPATEDTTSKLCSKCGVVKPLDDFGLSSFHQDGKKPACKACLNEDQRRYKRASVAAVEATRQRPIVTDPAQLGPGDPFSVSSLDWAWAFVIFRDVPGFAGYRAGTDGSIWTCWSLGRGTRMTDRWRRMSPHRNQEGYLRVYLTQDKQRQLCLVHQLILTAFVGSKPSGLECRHLDDDKTNNRLGNLLWGTRAENSADMAANGGAASGVNNGNSKLTPERVREIRRLCADGISPYKIAERFGVVFSTVYAIRDRKIWKHVD